MTRTKKWLIYYAACILLTVLGVILLNGHICVNAYSLIPLIVMVILALRAVGARKYENFEASIHSVKFSKRDGDASFSVKPPSHYDTAFDRLEEAFYLVCLALPLPFVFLFQGNIKIIASGVALCIPFLIPLITLPLFIRQLTEAKREHEQRLKELEEQKKREEMGEWK